MSSNRSSAIVVITAGLLFHYDAHGAQKNDASTIAAVSTDKPNAPAQVTVSGSVSDLDARRESIAGKIVVGRKAIEESGVATVHELLKRQPSITVSSNGRLGLMGMPGYTQILIDGVAPVAGKNPLDTDVVHIERIEIVKSALAEFGPYGSAGTINIVSRKITRRSNTQLRTGLSGGERDGGASVAWSTNRSTDGSPISYALQLSAGKTHQLSEEKSTLFDIEAGRMARLRERGKAGIDNDSARVSGGATLTWQATSTDKLSIEPGFMALDIDVDSHNDHAWIPPHTGALRSTQSARSPFRSISMPLRWNKVFADRSTVALSLSPTRFSVRRDVDRTDAFASNVERRARDERSERSADFLKADYTTKVGAQHTVKLGTTVGRNTEDTRFESLVDGAPDPSLARLGADRAITDRRLNVYIQDTAQLTTTLGANAGVTFETRKARIREGALRSTSAHSILSPSANLSWRPDPASKHQVRLGVARTFNAPFSDQLTLRPEINPLAPCASTTLCGANSAAFADRTGNPNLQPEKALGLNLALERYIAGDTVVTVELFARRITDAIGTDLVLLDVPWAQAPRYVLRPENLGTARSLGASVELQMLATDLWAGAPKLELRGALTVARSRISTVPGPDNRIANQSPWTAKLGGGYALNSVPLKVNVDLNTTPAGWIRTSLARRTYHDRRVDLSMDGAWTFSPALKLRLNLDNLGSTSLRSREEFFAADGGALRFTDRSRVPTVGLRLEQRF
ncbi:TonB-dependent siderophore receptor [Massilia sp. Leaf139]|uniref:TonB-dependent receptor plug domain-containing protein n=1 Tax=Massilia sp. Leaf139 TaxID=1736272 RepID=UPI000A8C2D8E|nr:TonB-dependent receptor [Massilia sp. Leaf139]